MKCFALIITLTLLGCSEKTYPTLKIDEVQDYPVFSKGSRHEGDTYIFHDSIVYYTHWSDDLIGSRKIFPFSKWKWINDSTIELNALSNNLRQPDKQVFVVNSESQYCNLLIPIDSLNQFHSTLYVEFKTSILDWTYVPDSSEQKLIDEELLLYNDSISWSTLFERENIKPRIRKFTNSFHKLGIWRGEGFNGGGNRGTN